MVSLHIFQNKAKLIRWVEADKGSTTPVERDSERLAMLLHHL